jgi:hypothetical protein
MLVTDPATLEPRPPHSPQGLGDASALWVEFQSVIRGSKESLKSPRKMLQLDEYVALERRGSVLGAEQRRRVYSLFRQVSAPSRSPE